MKYFVHHEPTQTKGDGQGSYQYGTQSTKSYTTIHTKKQAELETGQKRIHDHSIHGVKKEAEKKKLYRTLVRRCE